MKAVDSLGTRASSPSGKYACLWPHVALLEGVLEAAGKTEEMGRE